MLDFKLPEQMVMLIMRTLGKQPHDEVRPVIDELVKQINAQRFQGDNVTRLRDAD